MKEKPGDPTQLFKIFQTFPMPNHFIYVLESTDRQDF